MRSKKILHLIETVGPGGAETVFYNNLEYLRLNDSNNEHIAGFTKDGWIYNYIKEEGHKTVLFKTCKSFDFQLIKNLIKFIKNNNINFIHSHLPDLSFYASIASKIAGIPHVMTEHGDASHFSKSWNRLFIKYLGITFLSSRIICVSKFNEDVLRKKFPLFKKKLSIIYNGIKISGKIKPSFREKIRKDLNIQPDEIAICNIGNLYPVKGHKNLIYAMKNVTESYPCSKLIIIGRGELDSRLKSIVKKLNIEKHVIFLGFRKDARNLLSGMDFFVLSSFSEGFPISIIEAMDAGLPIVSTKVGGISEIKEFGGDVYLVLKNTPELLAQQIKKVIILHKCGSQKNKNIVRDNFSVDKMSLKYKNLYKNLITKTG